MTGAHARARRPWAIAAAALTIAVFAGTATAQAAGSAVVSQDWTAYQASSTRAGFTADNAITTANAGTLALRPGWPVKLGGGISTQPVTANGLVYAGAWNGDEYAVASSGAVAWKTALGVTTPATTQCGSPMGVASTPAVATVTVGKDTQASSVLFLGGGGNDAVGGGSAKLVALDAKTGAVRWSTALGPSPATMIWSSPLVATPPGATGPVVYVGVSSYGDCPLVQAKVVAVSASTGAIQHTFAVVPAGCSGGSIWGSPTYDPSDASLYVATGNAGGGCKAGEPYSEAVVKLHAADLSVVSAWQVPAAEAPGDSDFGSTPTLFSGTVTPTGAQRSLIGVGNKNGTFYVFDRAHVSQGPIARLAIAIGGDCPECGQGTISPAAYDGATLYVGGGKPTTATSPKGAVRAYNPNNLGSPRWTHNAGSGPVLGAVVASPGLVVFGESNSILVVNASTSSTVGWLHRGTGAFYGAPSIGHGVVYEGDVSGYLFAYSLGGK